MTTEATRKKLTLGKIVLRVRARSGKTQAEFLAFLGIKAKRTIISSWENDTHPPRSTHMVLLVEKITPHLYPEELAALEELS